MHIPDHLTTRHCNACGQETKQRDLGGTRGAKIEGPSRGYSWHMYHTIECLGCNAMSFVDRLWVHPGPMIGDAAVEHEIFYPVPPYKEKPDWAAMLDHSLVELLDEVYSAASHGLFTVASMGVRAVVDLSR